MGEHLAFTGSISISVSSVVGSRASPAPTFPDVRVVERIPLLHRAEIVPDLPSSCGSGSRPLLAPACVRAVSSLLTSAGPSLHARRFSRCSPAAMRSVCLGGGVRVLVVVREERQLVLRHRLAATPLVLESSPTGFFASRGGSPRNRAHRARGSCLFRAAARRSTPGSAAARRLVGVSGREGRVSLGARASSRRRGHSGRRPSESGEEQRGRRRRRPCRRSSPSGASGRARGRRLRLRPRRRLDDVEEGASGPRAVAEPRHRRGGCLRVDENIFLAAGRRTFRRSQARSLSFVSRSAFASGPAASSPPAERRRRNPPASVRARAASTAPPLRLGVRLPPEQLEDEARAGVGEASAASPSRSNHRAEGVEGGRRERAIGRLGRVDQRDDDALAVHLVRLLVLQREAERDERLLANGRRLLRVACVRDGVSSGFSSSRYPILDHRREHARRRARLCLRRNFSVSPR